MNATPVRPQSGFVTVLAWLMLIFNAFGVFGSLVQNAAINFLLPDIAIAQADPASPQVPLPMGLLRSLGVIGFVFSLLMVWSAWALLRRREWARRMYVWMFVLGIALNVLGAIAFWVGTRTLDPALLGGPQVGQEVRAIMQGMMFFVATLVVGFSLLYAWLAKRLSSPEIKAEFAAPGDSE